MKEDIARVLAKETGKMPDMYFRREKKTQEQIIKEWLLRNGSITPAVSWFDLGIYRLSEIIRRLKAKGMNIETEMQRKNGRPFGKYKLIKS